MMQLKNLFTIFLLVSVSNLVAQDVELGEFKPGEQSYGLNKLKKADKIYTQISGAKLFLLSGTRPLNTYNITEVSVYDFNTQKLHLIGKSEPVAKTIGGQQLPSGWFTPTENGIHLITNLNSGVSGVSGSIVGEVKLLTYDLEW